MSGRQWTVAARLAACASRLSANAPNGCDVKPASTSSTPSRSTSATLSAVAGADATIDAGAVDVHADTAGTATATADATAGGLVFTGEGNGLFKAYDAETGAVLWKFQAGAGVNAPPSSSTVDGQQFIVVAAGGNAQLDYKRGNNIIAFTLAD